MSSQEKYLKMAREILETVGGEANVTNVTHCMTRMRFNLKDESLANHEEIKAIEGVIGVINSGGQLQIIIGQTVDQVYQQLCNIGHFETLKEVGNNTGSDKKKLTLKTIGPAILDGIAGCLTPLIPLLMAASMFKLLAALLGPDMLNLVSADGDTFKLFTFVGDAGFYFFPIIVGYTASKKFGVTPVTGMFLGAIMIHPTFVEMSASGTPFTLFGLPVSVQNYASTIVPIILSIWVMSYVERFFKKYLPTALKTIFAPFLTILVMLPIALVVLGPAGAFVGVYICNGLLGFSGVGGFIAIAIIGALWEFLVMSGMHLVMISTLILVFSTNGSEALVSPAACAASFAVPGMCLGAAFLLKDKEQKSLSIGYIVAALIGGVTEPGLYGVGMRYKSPLIGLMVGGFVGGLYGGITGLTAYTLIPVASVLNFLSYAGGSTMNFINGILTGVIAFTVAAIVTYFVGIKESNRIPSQRMTS